MKSDTFVFLLIAASLVGCGQATPSYRPGQTPVTIAAQDQQQQYNLYAVGDRVPLMCELVIRNEPVGFARDDSGRLLAVAGQQRRQLAESRYQWRPVEPEKSLDVSESVRQSAATVITAGAIGLYIVHYLIPWPRNGAI